MTRILLPLLLILSLALSACGTTPQTPAPAADSPAPAVSTAQPASGSAPEPAARPALDTGYENALPTRLLLSLGTLQLAETANAVNAEQAPQLLMLWQALTNLTNSGTGATEEVDALLTQIEQTLSPEQVTAINAMRLTQTELQAWAQTNGIQTGTGAGSGGGGGGSGSGLSPEARATRQAENGKTGQTGSENGLSAALTQALIAYLQGIQ